MQCAAASSYYGLQQLLSRTQGALSRRQPRRTARGALLAGAVLSMICMHKLCANVER